MELAIIVSQFDFVAKFLKFKVLQFKPESRNLADPIFYINFGTKNNNQFFKIFTNLKKLNLCQDNSGTTIVISRDLFLFLIVWHWNFGDFFPKNSKYSQIYSRQENPISWVNKSTKRIHFYYPSFKDIDN